MLLLLHLKLSLVVFVDLTQLTNLDPKGVSDLMPKLFVNWNDKYEIGKNDAPWIDHKWIVLLWQYLNNHFSKELHLLEGLHIISLTSDCTRMLKLSKQFAIISRTNSSGSALPNDLATVCDKLGIYIIDNVQPELYKHPQFFGRYAFLPTAEGLLQAMSRLPRADVAKNLLECTDKVRLCLRNFLAKDITMFSLSESDKQLLKTLPIFTTVNGSGREKARPVSLTEVSIAAPSPIEGKIPVPSPEVLLNLDDESSKHLAAACGVKQKLVAVIVAKVYFRGLRNGWYSTDEMMTFMKYFCENLKQFRQNYDNIEDLGKEIRFVQKADGTYVRPCDVFDEAEKLIAQLFSSQAVFPTGEFAKPKYTEALKDMGLKNSSSLTAAEMYDIAVKLSSGNLPAGEKRTVADAFNQLLNRRSELLGQSVGGLPHVTLRDKLISLPCIPIMSRRADSRGYPQSLPFYGENASDGFATPAQVAASKYANLIGSVRPLVDLQGLAMLAKMYGWNDEPNIEHVTLHLMNVVHYYNCEQKVQFLNVVCSIYRFVNEHKHYVKSFVIDMTNRKWIWNGESFSDPSQIVLGKDSLELKPYRFTLPAELSKFRHLWIECGLKTKSDLAEVLKAVNDRHEHENDLEERTVDHDIQLCVNVLNSLAKQERKDAECLLIPISTKTGKLQMKPAAECTYVDKEWYQHDFDIEDLKADVFLVHELVPTKTAEQLNIPSLISRTLQVEELDTGFGQSEPLTRRLNAILRDYADGLAVLKELIQNADDAGASEICFLYDERYNEDARHILLDQGMKELQGPALWTYNNAVFAESDFENIVKLSGATKEKDGQKIGRFGLGFNAVYHLTDVPSFVSRGNIVFFDPHTKYLGRTVTNKGKPGIKLNLDTHRHKIQRLTDQFKPYNDVFDCDLSKDSTMESYKGTLFRFPLRTEEQARKSEISKQHYSDTEMIELLSLLETAKHHILLYTQNVRLIKVFHLTATATSAKEMTLWFSVERQLVKEMRNATSSKSTLPKDAGKFTPSNTLPNNILQQCSLLMENYKQGRLKIGHFCEFSAIHNITVKYGNASHTKFAGKASTDSSSYWLVVSCSGRNKLLELACQDSSLIPVGGAAAQLERLDESSFKAVDIEFGLHSVGMVYCFLPLPIQFNLPVHINGYFAVHSSRTHLHERVAMDKEDKRAIWNEALMSDAVCQAYCVLIEDLTRCSQTTSYNIWPVAKSLKEIARLPVHLYQSLYHRICTDENCAIIRADDGWVALNRCMLLSPDFRKDEIADLALHVLKMTANQASTIVDIPEQVVKTILEVESCKTVMQQKFIDKPTFFKNWFFPNIRKIDAITRDKLVLSCLFDDKLKQLLMDVECIPVSPDSEDLKTISELVHPNCKLAELYDADEGYFPLWKSDVADDDEKRRCIYDALVKLGMKKHDLSWEEIAERCMVIQSNPCTATKRTKIVISLMSSNLTKKKIIHSQRVLEAIRRTKFLPVMKHPADFPVRWEGDNNVLVSANEGYLTDKKYLVCCSYPVIDRNCFDAENKDVKKMLGLLDKTVEITTAINQIRELRKAAADKNVAEHQQCMEQFNHVYHGVFTFLNTVANRLNSHEKTVLSELHCVLVDKTLLMLPSRCAMTSTHRTMSLLPYLAVIPSNAVKLYGQVLKAIGVKDNFTLADYVWILREVQKQSQDRELHADELELVIHVINQCVDAECQKSNTITTSMEDLPVPNAANCLSPARSLCFNNCPWLITPEDINCCHQKITYPATVSIGIKTIRQDIMKRHKLALPFGQKERLVKRIKRIIDSYPFSEDILKEMLQNADDAGATSVHFICDSRSLETEKVFDETWKAIQGPALCVYNDRSFTDKDIQGIQSLGEGSKSDDPVKTGQYGVGFNCVYHLTDVPTFFTTVKGQGTVLCAFDPNCKYVPGADCHNPGGMFRVTDGLQTNFCDVFSGYFTKHYDISKSGTVFRLPLRTRDVAKESEILQKEVTVEDIKSLFTRFRPDMYEALLFVNSVEEICLRKVTPGSTNAIHLQNEYSVRVQLTEYAKAQRNFLQSQIRKAAMKLRKKEKKLYEVKMTEVVYELTTEDSDKKQDIWQIVQRCGFEDSSIIPKSVSSAYQCDDLGLLPLGGVAYLKQSSSAGRHTAAKHNRLFCFLPLPVQLPELPVHVNGHFVLSNESRRGLWTDEHQSFKSEWNRCIMEGVVAPAYCTLIRTLKGSLRDRSSDCSSIDEAKFKLDKFLSVFPKISKAGVPYETSLTTAIYKYIGTENLDVLPLRSSTKQLHNVKWMGPLGQPNKKVYFDDLDSQIQTSEITSQLSQTVFRSSGAVGIHAPETDHEWTKPHLLIKQALMRCGFLLFACPLRVCINFEKAGVQVERIKPEAVLKFFASYNQHATQCKLGVVPSKLEETALKEMKFVEALLKYCCKVTNYKQKLVGLPLLVTKSLLLTTFDSQDRKYVTDFSDVAPNAPEMFMHSYVSKVLQIDTTEDVHLCRQFDVAEFSKLLPAILSSEDYCGAEKTVSVSMLEELLRESNYDSRWLARVWSFFASFIPFNPLTVQPEAANAATILMPVVDWCLLPVSCGRSELLFPIRHSSAVLNFKDETPSELVDILKKLGVAEVNWKYIDRTTRLLYFVKSLLGSIHQPQCIVSALKYLLEQNTLEGTLSVNEGLRLLAYFSDNVTALGSDDDTKNVISRLPFFVSKFSTQISISRACTYVVPAVPGNDMQIWREELNVTFLMQQPSIDKLINHLGCKRLTVVEAYMFILPHFNKLSPTGQEVHIAFVRDHLRQLKPLPGLPLSTCNKRTKSEITLLTKALKSLAFLPSQQADDSLVTAANYYDVHHEVFRAMLPECKFPPAPYRDFVWKEFLLDCGIIHEVTEDMFVEFAMTVQSKAAEAVTDTICQQSEILLKHFLQGNDLRTPTFLDRIKSICFIRPEEVSKHLEHLHPQHGVRDATGSFQFIHFQHSALSRNKELIWTTKNILPPCVSEHELKTDGDQHRKLQVVEEPTPDDVAQHVKQLCTHVINRLAIDDKRNETTAKTLGNALKYVYIFLKEHSPLLPSVVSILTNTPLVCVPDSCKLFRPAQFAANILEEQEIKPYLNKFPLPLGEFFDLFLQLGTTKLPTISQYAGVIEAIRDNTEEQTLHPQESKDVTTALTGMFTLMRNDRQGRLAIPDRIYLPSRSKKLLLSSDVVYVDDESLLKRLRGFQKPLLIDLKHVCCLTNEEDVKKVLQKLPAVQQPACLSSMVKEYLDEGCDDTDSDIANELRNILTSAEFRTGVQRLARHCLANKSLTPDNVNLTIQNICSKMQRIRIIGKSEIKTHLECEGKRIPNSEKPLPFFHESINEDGNSIQQIYVQSSHGSLTSLHYLVAKVVNKTAENHLSEDLALLTTIIGCPLQEIDEVLNHHGIIGLNTAIKQFNLPIGSIVPQHKHCYLVQSVFSFEIERLVALELDDPLDRGERGGAKYKLVLILERLHEDSESIMADRYRVKVSSDGEEQIVDASLLYAFSRDGVPRDVLEQDDDDEDDRDNMIVLRPPGSSSAEGPSPEPELPSDFRDIINLLKRQLKEAWTLAEEQRRRIVRRLQLQWHPDKHPPEKKSIMTKVFQTLQNLVTMLEEGKQIDDVDEDEASRGSTTSRNANYDFMGERAKNYRHYWEQQHASNSHHSRRPTHGGFTNYRDQYADFFTDFRPPPNPQPAEAERWMRQAKYDLQAANNDEIPEWACYKCHQVNTFVHHDT